jgi:1,5-anhydro-D-fructose reductase (1,5-anhydro-D-mannitol-forming)
LAGTKLRFGIAGFGKHAMKRLVLAFKRSELCELHALSRRDDQKAAASAFEFNVPRAFTSTAEMCQDPDVQAIFVASPDSLHLPDVLDAVAHGKHALCEKPMAMNAAECGKMVEAVRQAKVVLGVAHVFRFAASVHYVRELVASGRLGDITQARLQFHYWNEGHGRSWINDASLACGGPLADVGIHCIDTLRFILQDEVEEVSTTAISDARSQPFEASAMMALQFSRGVLAEVGVSTRAHYHTPIEVIGSQGVLRAEDFLSIDTPVQVHIAETPSGASAQQTLSNADAFLRQLDAFARAVDGSEAFPCTGDEGLRNQLVLDAAYRSWKSGRREKV